MNCLILTPLALELEAVRSHLNEPNALSNFICYGLTGSFRGQFHTYQITLLQTGAKNTDTALITEKAIQQFEPNIALLVGIAGGVKDVQLLDVVVANKCYGYESGKMTPTGFVARPEVYPFSRDLLTLSSAIISKKTWKNHSLSAPTANAIIGPICAGNKVIASTDSTVYQLIKSTYNDCVALEMEAIGFAKAVAYYPLLLSSTIRGISDLIDAKSTADEQGSQPKAAANAAAFAFELLYQFDYSKITIPPMDIKTIAATTFTSLLPFLKKSKSIQQVSKEVSEATDTTLGTLWQKVKPIFIEEFEEENTQLSEEAVEESVVMHVLKKVLKKNEALKKELEALLDKAKEEGTSAKVVITNSKNVIAGSDITVGGDFHLGDNHSTTNHIGQQVNNHGKIGKQINIDKVDNLNID